jgi:hypothetical protein
MAILGSLSDMFGSMEKNEGHMAIDKIMKFNCSKCLAMTTIVEYGDNVIYGYLPYVTLDPLLKEIVYYFKYCPSCLRDRMKESSIAFNWADYYTIDD